MSSFSATPWPEIQRVRDGITKQISGASVLEPAAGTFTAIMKQAFDSVALARMFLLAPMHRLPDSEQDWARRLAASVGHRDEVDRATRVLCLLGTAGSQPEWNDRTKSVGHRAIPLLDRTFIANARSSSSPSSASAAARSSSDPWRVVSTHGFSSRMPRSHSMTSSAT